MAEFSVNTQRLDPYKNYKFRLKWDGKYVVGISKVSALKRTTEVVEHRDGGDPSTSHKSPGRIKYEAIILDRGLTQDLAFHDWAGLVYNYGAALAPKSLSPTSARTSIWSSTTRRDNWSSPTRSTAAGSQNIRPCRIWMRTPTG